MRYEIFYGTGGHAGPFTNDLSAVDHGIHAGEKVLMLAVYDASGVSGYRPVQLWKELTTQHWACEGVANLSKVRIPAIFHWMLR